MRVCLLLNLIVPALLAASDAAPAAAAPATAAEMAMVLLYEQAPRHPQAAGFLRKLAIALGERRIDLAEAERLVALADRLGMLGPEPAAVASVAASAPADPDPRQQLEALLDGPAPARAQGPAPEVLATQAASPARAAPAPTGPGPWLDVAGLGGRVISMAEGPQAVKFVMVKPDPGAVFTVGQDFVVRNGGSDLVRGVVTKVGADPSKAIFGNLIDDSWTPGIAQGLTGGEIVVGIRR